MSACNCWTSGPMCCRNQPIWGAQVWTPPPTAGAGMPIVQPIWNLTNAQPLIIDKTTFVENNGMNA